MAWYSKKYQLRDLGSERDLLGSFVQCRLLWNIATILHQISRSFVAVIFYSWGLVAVVARDSPTPPSDSWFSSTDVVIFKGAWNTGSRLGFEDLPTWGGRGEIFYLVAGWPLANSWNHASNLHLSLPVLNNLDNFHCFIRPALMCH